MKPAHKHPSEAMEPVMIAVAICGAAMTVVAFATSGPKSGISVSMGALLALSNLWALTSIVRALLVTDVEPSDDALSDDAAAAPAPQKHSRIGWALFAVFKMTLLFGAMYLLLRSSWVAGLPLAVGYGSMPIGIFLSTLWHSLRPAARA